MKKGRPRTGREPAARRIFCWGGDEGGPPHPPEGQRGWAARGRGKGPRPARGWGHKEFGKRRAPGRRASPARPSISRRELQARGPEEPAEAGARGSQRPWMRRGLRAGFGGRRQASAAAANPLRPSAQPPTRPRDPGVRVATPTHLLGPGREDSPTLPPATAARPTPQIYLLIFWAKARRSAMAAKAAAAVWARTGGRVPPHSRSLPRRLRQSLLRTREAGAGGRSRERARP